MTNQVFLNITFILSCIVALHITASVMKTQFQKKYSQKKVYTCLYVCLTIFLATVNLLKNPMINLLCWLLIAIVLGAFFYESPKTKRWKVVIQSILFYLLMGIAESIGYVAVTCLINLMGLSVNNSDGYTIIHNIGAQIVLIAIYRLFILRVLEKEKMKDLTRHQYVVYLVVMFSTVLSQVYLIPFIQDIRVDAMGIGFMCNITALLFLNLYISDLIGYLSENNKLKVRIELLNQRAELQEEHFIALDKRYEVSLKVLHDINKHIKVITGLYQQEKSEKAISYTQDIVGMLTPLIPVKYVSNHILNTILNDKATIAKEKNIECVYTLENIDFDFMEQIDITALFSNILDNAIEACEKVERDRKINLIMSEKDGVIWIREENTCLSEIEWDMERRPVSPKGEGHGIGLGNVENVLKKYGGEMFLDMENHIFSCSITLSR